jgi:hypothetical protein
MARADQRRALRAGNLHADYENGDVRFLRLGDLPVLDRIYVRIRDAGWATVRMHSELASIEESSASFRIVSSLRWGADPAWATGTLAVSASESELSALARITFHRDAVVQRAGLNLHHPLASTVGRRYRWDDGSSSGAGIFPEVIYPQIRNQSRFLPMIGPLRRLVIDADSRTSLAFAFDGALFETEDQRNWTDASFKTYGPPIDGLAARRQAPGSTITQAVRVRIATRSAIRPARRSAPQRVTIDRRPLPPFPPIGATATSLWPEPAGPAGPMAGEAPAGVGTVEHVRADVWPAAADSIAGLARICARARDNATPLELALHGTGTTPESVHEIFRLVADIPLRGILALGPGTEPTAEGVVASLREQAAAHGLSAPIAAGTAGHFSEVNRARAAVLGADVVVWSTSPQVHEPDDATVMQAAPIVAETADSAAVIWPGLGSALSGIRLAPVKVSDSRADGAFGAAWLVAVLAGLAGTRCAWLTLDLPLRLGDPAAAAPSPVSHVLAAVSQLRHRPLLRAQPVHDRSLAVLASAESGGARLLIAELAGQASHRVRVAGRITRIVPVTSSAGAARGDPETWANRSPELTLGPYEVVQASVRF